MEKRDFGPAFFTVFLILMTSFTTTGLYAQSETVPFVSHYVLPDFSIGTIKMKDGNTGQAMMNYNMLTEEMIFEKNGVMLAIDSLSSIDTIYFESKEFIPHNKIFFEVLVKGPVSLFVQHKCTLLSAGSPSGYGGTTETGAATSTNYLANSGRAYKLKLPDEYHITDATQYWIRRDGEYYKANSIRQIIKIFPVWSKDLKKLINQNKLNVKDPNDLITIVIHCNHLMLEDAKTL